MEKYNSISPRFRVYGDFAEFETERHLEWFFWDTVLPKIEFKPLANQYRCQVGICDILALTLQSLLIKLIVSLKTTCLH